MVPSAEAAVVLGTVVAAADLVVVAVVVYVGGWTEAVGQLTAVVLAPGKASAAGSGVWAVGE